MATDFLQPTLGACSLRMYLNEDLPEVWDREKLDQRKLGDDTASVTGARGLACPACVRMGRR